MNINEMLKTLPYRKATFVRYYFNLWFDSNRKMTEEEFLKLVDRKSMNTFSRWMRTDEWKNVVATVYASKAINDIKEIYDTVAVKAKEGDPKAVDTLLKLQRELNQYKIEADTYFLKQQEDIEDDELEYS